MLALGQGEPPGIMSGNGGLSSVHGQPVLSDGGGESSVRVEQRMVIVNSLAIGNGKPPQGVPGEGHRTQYVVRTGSFYMTQVSNSTSRNCATTKHLGKELVPVFYHRSTLMRSAEYEPNTTKETSPPEHSGKIEFSAEAANRIRDGTMGNA